MGERGGFFNIRGQVSIFIIIAIILVGSIITYFILRGTDSSSIPSNFKPAYDSYLSCIQGHAKQGISLMGEQAGWIEPPEFIPGSQYMPFSSQLDFLGQPVPYWLYVSGNNFLREQVPTKSQMQDQLEKYISDRINYCSFEEFPNVNLEIGQTPDIDVKIEDAKVNVIINNLLVFSSENQSVSVKQQKFEVRSKLGKYYQLALDIYNFEKNQMFLEKYGLDVLRLYAPVTGVEVTCAPKIFKEKEIRNSISSGLSENMAALKIKGNYYSLSNSENKYFVTDIGKNIDENVNFIYSASWPTRIEIYGEDVAEPVGLQEGLGILGFCYVPYHLVYDIDFPVLIQIYDNQEIFQFPISVIIDKNQARNSLSGEAGGSIESEICKYKNYPIKITTYDSSLNPIESQIKFKCLNTECSIGKSAIQGNEAVFTGNIPGCVNGFIIAKAEGYADGKYQISSNEESTADIILNKKYNTTVDLGNVESALIYFKSPDYSASMVYPDTRNIELVEGYYNISVYAFKNSSLRLSSISEKKCVNVPRSGIAGIFGAEEEKCYNIDIPAQDINFVLTGGGKTEEYLTEGQLSRARKLNLNIPLFKVPSNIQEVQDNYLELEDSKIYAEVIE